jgi:ribosome modulation factor
MALSDLQRMAHLWRRAGFGATRDVLEAAVEAGYEATVEALLYPEAVPDVETDLFERYYIDAKDSFQLDGAQIAWVYRMQGHLVFQFNPDESQRLEWLGGQPTARCRNIRMACPSEQANRSVA